MWSPATPVAGFDLPHVHNAWELFGVGRRPRIEGPALVFDDTGTFEAISAAELLLAAGVEVIFVSRFDKPGESLPYPPVTVGAARERLMAGRCDFVGGHHLRRIAADHVEIGVLYTDRVRRIPARTVVLAGFNAPNRDLAGDLAARGVKLHVVGDARGQSGIMHAIHGAAEVARSI